MVFLQFQNYQKHKLNYFFLLLNTNDNNLNHPTISGPLKLTTPLIKPENAKRTVINLTDTKLTTAQIELLSLGLKFSPTEVKPNIATIASKIEPSTRSYDPAIENAIANDITNILQTPSPLKPNLKPHLSAALKSLQKQNHAEDNPG